METLIDFFDLGKARDAERYCNLIEQPFKVAVQNSGDFE